MNFVYPLPIFLIKIHALPYFNSKDYLWLRVNWKERRKRKQDEFDSTVSQDETKEEFKTTWQFKKEGKEKGDDTIDEWEWTGRKDETVSQDESKTRSPLQFKNKGRRNKDKDETPYSGTYFFLNETVSTISFLILSSVYFFGLIGVEGVLLWRWFTLNLRW